VNDLEHDDAQHRARTRDVYDRLAPVWSATTDDGPFNGGLERPALRSLIPRPLAGSTVLDAGCGSGAQCAWLLDQGAEVVGVDLSPGMIEMASDRCSGRGRFLVADLAEPLPVPPNSCDGVSSSLALHYLREWSVALASFATVLRPGGWVVLSLDHPFGPTLAGQNGGYIAAELVPTRGARPTWRSLNSSGGGHWGPPSTRSAVLASPSIASSRLGLTRRPLTAGPTNLARSSTSLPSSFTGSDSCNSVSAAGSFGCIG